MEEEKIIKYYKQMIEDLTFAEWAILKNTIDKTFYNEIKGIACPLKIDTSKIKIQYLKNIKHNKKKEGK